MSQFGADSLATLEFILHWRDRFAAHEEHYLARRVNAWRDIFPPRLAQKLQDAQEGDTVTVDYSPGEAVAAYDPDKALVLSRADLETPRSAGREIPVVEGRFYPQGLLQRQTGVYPQNIVPFRLLEKDGDRVTIDCNHPLAGRPLQLTVNVQWIQDKQSDTGGLLSHWMEELCHYGPGMQAVPQSGSVVVPPSFFARSDEREDSHFYGEPRLISHVDDQADRNLRTVYQRFLKPGLRVLDLMSSKDSHLPDTPGLTVTGLGMNDQEMAANPALSHWIVHDLNADPAIPESLFKSHFDAVVCSLSIEYLTHPVEVLHSALERLVPGGVMLVGFSDRWFPAKAVTGWMDLHPFERSGHVLQWLREAGFKGEAGSVSIRNDWRPRNDPHFLETRGVSDPVFVAWSYKD